MKGKEDAKEPEFLKYLTKCQVPWRVLYVYYLI